MIRTGENFFLRIKMPPLPFIGAGRIKENSFAHGWRSF